MEKISIPSYIEGLTELRDQLKEMLPSNALTTFDNDAAQLEKNHSSILKLNTGDIAPDFSLVNAIGETIRLNDLLQKGKVVLTFTEAHGARIVTYN